MDISKSATTDKPDTEASHEPVQQTDACATQRLNIRMAQNILLIWLDSNIDENNADCRTTIEQFRHVIYNINTYADEHKCIQFLQAIEYEKACMVISDTEASHEPVQQTDACATQRLNIRMAQNILLIWLDSNIDENNADCRNTIEQHVIYNINTYADDHCIKFLHAIEHEKACMVISS